MPDSRDSHLKMFTIIMLRCFPDSKHYYPLQITRMYPNHRCPWLARKPLSMNMTEMSSLSPRTVHAHLRVRMKLDKTTTIQATRMKRHQEAHRTPPFESTDAECHVTSQPLTSSIRVRRTETSRSVLLMDINLVYINSRRKNKTI